MITTGPFNLVLNTEIELADPLSQGGNQSVAVQLQNASGFTLRVLADGDSLTIQSFTAQTVPLAGNGTSVAVIPITDGPAEATPLFAVWLLAGESPPMVDGPLTAQAISAALVGTADVNVINSTLPISGDVAITSGTVDATITGGSVNIAAGTVDVVNPSGIDQLNVGPIELQLSSGTIPVSQSVSLSLPSWCNTVSILCVPQTGNTNPALIEATGATSGFQVRQYLSTQPSPPIGNLLLTAGKWSLGGSTGPIATYPSIDASITIFFNQGTVGGRYYVIGSNEYYNQIVSGSMGIYGIAGAPSSVYNVGGALMSSVVGSTTGALAILSAPTAGLPYRLHRLSFFNTGAKNLLSLIGFTSGVDYSCIADTVGATGGSDNLDGQLVTEALTVQVTTAATYRATLTYDIVRTPVLV